jgi:F-type H+-transporting ATPase subunit delta
LIESSVARRYARALFSLSVEDTASGSGSGSGIETTLQKLAELQQALSESAEGRALLEPGAPLARQRHLVEKLAVDLGPLLTSFLGLVVARGRFDGLPQIVLALRGLVDAHLGRVRAKVTTPFALAPEDLKRVGLGLAAATRRTIVLQSQVDPSLIGGLVAEVGGVQYDGSLRTQLSRLKSELTVG